MILSLSAPLLLQAYAAGIFPMADDADTEHVDWFEPTKRGILPLDEFHVPRRLARTVRRNTIDVRLDSDFVGVMRACAAPGPGRPTTWINRSIIAGYMELYEMGHAHSVECWRDGEMVGGLYGVSIGGAFFGESMFSRERDASKIALVHLAARLRAGGYVLLDTQFITDHLRQFGAVEIDRRDYRQRLKSALTVAGDWVEVDQAQAIAALLGDPAGDDQPPVAQPRTQTS